MLKRIFATILLSLSISVYAAEIPIDAKLDYNQGIDFYKLGMYERAIESFRSAIRTYPDYIDAYYNLATILEYLKQYAEALSVYKQVYLRNPNDYEVVYKLALMSSKLEDYTKASEYLSLIPPTNSYYKKAQELAESIKVSTTLPPQKTNVRCNRTISVFSHSFTKKLHKNPVFEKIFPLSSCGLKISLLICYSVCESVIPAGAARMYTYRRSSKSGGAGGCSPKLWKEVEYDYTRKEHQDLYG